MSRSFKSVHLALQLYATNPQLRGGFGQIFGKQLKAVDKHENDPFKGTYTFNFPKNHKNIQHTVHGGALATMIDIATTVTMIRLTSQRTISISLNTEFLRVTPVQSHVEIYTEVTKIGKHIVYSDCAIYTDPDSENRKLACKGTHTKMIMKDDWDFITMWESKNKKNTD